jgi:hypothetical protein
VVRQAHHEATSRVVLVLSLSRGEDTARQRRLAERSERVERVGITVKPSTFCRCAAKSVD